MKIFNRTVPAMVLALIVLAGLGSAGLLAYYGMITGTAIVEQSVKVDGKSVPDSLAISYDASGVAGSTVIEGPHTLTNNANVEAPIIIETTYDPDGVGISTKYTSEIILTEKIVDFSKDVWEIPGDAKTVKVGYTMVGDTFTAEVTKGADENYVLIYYKDNSDRFNSPAKAILIEGVVGNLPYEDDENIDEYDYCATGEYKTCHGAKIWYVPATAINGDGSLDWGRASEFFYETELIQYNKDGKISLYPDTTLSFNIVNDFNVALTPGTYKITTKIAPQ